MPPEPSADRLSADDLAALRDAQFRDAAEHRVRQAAQQPGHRCGVCANCGERCLPTAIYCDDDCRADHERRVRLGRLAGRLID